MIKRTILVGMLALSLGFAGGLRGEDKAEKADKAAKTKKAGAPRATEPKQAGKVRAGAAKKDPLAPIQEDPNLPRVLLIGDSISMGYTLPVRDALKGKANLLRIPTNGGPTTNGVKKLKSWLGEKKWDVIVFNFGLHDMKTMPETKAAQVSLADYEKNLKTIVKQLKETKAALIWATTTPVQDSKTGAKVSRQSKDVDAYNAAAEKVVKAEGITMADLHAAAKEGNLEKIQSKDGVHFTEEGSKLLAEKVAAEITTALKK